MDPENSETCGVNLQNQGSYRCCKGRNILGLFWNDTGKTNFWVCKVFVTAETPQGLQILSYKATHTKVEKNHFKVKGKKTKTEFMHF